MTRALRSLRSLAVLAALATMVAAAPAHAQRRECLDCHEDFKSVLKRSHVHQPARESCETCHKRHGFTQKLVLVKDQPDLCTGCHEDVKTEIASGGHVHGALSEGGCTGCHDPHASDDKMLLRTVEKGSTLCASCHADIAAIATEKDLHEPFKKGDCSVCHAPHSSNQAALLVTAEKELCERCHAGAAGKHKVAGVGEFSCSSCHDPHRSSKRTPLAAHAHPPFASGECDACHTLKDGKVTVADVPAADMCESCHDQEAALVAGAQSHFGASEMKGRGSKACLECHDPHVSGRAAMLVADESELCRKCHDKLPRKLEHEGSIHPPFAEGKCTSCHNPHGGSAPHKLVKAPNELCTSCHADVARTPGKGEVAHAAMQKATCTDCHDGHMSTQPALLTKAPGELCSSCHARESFRHTHLPYQTASCEGCHRNHGHQKGLLAGTVKETCGACHQQQIAALSAATKHPPAQEDDCLSCHQPHGSANEGLLAEPQRDLCWSCHDVNEIVLHAPKPTSKTAKREDDDDDDKAAPTPTGKQHDMALHPPVENGDCSSCHDAHGSALPSLLTRTGDTLCYGCHAQQKIDFAAGNVHPPVADGKCSTCHTPHGSSFGALATNTEPALCTQCHDLAKPEIEKAHKNIDVSGATCTSCHAPHSSSKASLLNAVVHEPFADGDCETCHEIAKTPAGLSKVSAVSATLCYDCHDDKQSGKGHQHVEGVACVTCHRPHSSPSEHLLDHPSTLCQGCHGDVLEPKTASATTTVFVHKPAAAGRCRDCHKMHDSPGAPLLASTEKELCSTCHASVQARKGDRTQHPPFGKGECSRCHETHASTEPHLLKDAEGELCTSCHGLTSPKLTRAHKQVPLTGRTCVSCHDPHSTKAAASKLVYEKKHPPFADGDCSVCHDAAGKPDMAVSACTDCHDGQRGYVAVHDAHRGPEHAGSVEACLDCHSPHAGHDKLLVRSSEQETCLQCHDRGMFTKKVVHAALEDGCSTCHNVHDNNIGELRGARVNDLCGTCHDAAKTHAHKTSGVPDPRTGAELSCVSCHNPHSSDFEHLVPFDFKRDLCVQCHATGMSPDG